ncbi:hypothetical protein N665_0398s0008 [Sinapis alba]|nr:hypothetical protein N665_0398s0008 [Sinapis alba]
MLNDLPGSRRLDDLHVINLLFIVDDFQEVVHTDDFQEVVHTDDFQEVIQMIRHIPVVYGEWLVKDDSWDFVVDKAKGARIFFLSEGSTHFKLVEMAVEDYNLEAKVVELTYLLPEAMRHQDTPPIHVTSDKQVQNLIDITKMHDVRLCFSSRVKLRTVKDENIEAEDTNEVSEEGEEDDDGVENDDWEEDVNLPKAENDDWEEDVNFPTAENDDWKEDVNLPKLENVEADDLGEDYSEYGKVKDEEEE